MYKTLEDFVGNTPLVRLKKLPGETAAANGNVILAKLEGNNPAGLFFWLASYCKLAPNPYPPRSRCGR